MKTSLALLIVALAQDEGTLPESGKLPEQLKFEWTSIADLEALFAGIETEEKDLAARIAEWKKKEAAADPNQDPVGMRRLLQERRKAEGQLSELRERNRRDYRIRKRNEVRDRCLEGLKAPLTLRGG